MKSQEVCMICGNGFEPGDVSGTSDLLYGRTICEKCHAERDPELLELYMIRARKVMPVMGGQ